MTNQKIRFEVICKRTFIVIFFPLILCIFQTSLFSQDRYASLTLNTLHCIEQWDEDGDSEPYIWTAFFYIDKNSIEINGAAIVHVGWPPRENWVSVKNGNSRNIPSKIGHYDHTLTNGQIPVLGEDGVITMKSIPLTFGVLVLLFEEDTLPEDAITAGHQVFATEVRSEINTFIKTNRRVPNDNEVSEIADKIYSKVYDAIYSATPWYHYFKGPDDYFTHALKIYSNFNNETFNSNFTISLSSEQSVTIPQTFGVPAHIVKYSQNYEIQGQFITNHAPFERCKKESDKVEILLNTIRNLEGARSQYIKEHAEPDHRKIEEFQRKLVAARKDLVIAQSQLSSCKKKFELKVK